MATFGEDRRRLSLASASFFKVAPMTNPNYEHQWRKAAIAAVAREPIVDRQELELFSHYFNSTNSLIETWESEVRAGTQREIEEGEDFPGEGSLVVDYFVRRLRYGQVVHLHSLVEHFLTAACERLSCVAEHRVIFSLSELSGEKLLKRRKFLERYGNFKISDESWLVVKELVLVRNIIVHSFGRLTDDKLATSNARQGLSVEYGELIVEASFIEACIPRLGELFKQIDSEIRTVADRVSKPYALQPAE